MRKVSRAMAATRIEVRARWQMPEVSISSAFFPSLRAYGQHVSQRDLQRGPSTQGEAGLKRLFTQFSFLNGIRSHFPPECPQSVHELPGRRATDRRAADAVELLCCRAKKFLGAMVAALGGLDMLIFSGGIGEHSTEARLKICNGPDATDIGIDQERDTAGNEIISDADNRVTVRVIGTDEELAIAVMVQATSAGQVEKHVGVRKSGGSHGT
jgi:Acetokinase family/XFP N-terminal domain